MKPETTQTRGMSREEEGFVRRDGERQKKRDGGRERMEGGTLPWREDHLRLREE